MREPRPRQRLPEGGLEILEKRKAGAQNLNMLIAYPQGWKEPRIPTPSSETILSWGYTMIYQPHFDPMLYFWPVDGAVILVHTASLEGEHSKRIVRAALRDGCDIVALVNATALSTHSVMYNQESGWKEPANEWVYQIPERSLRMHGRCP